MATLCSEVCSCCRRWNRRKSPSFGKVMGESSLTTEYDGRKCVSFNSSTAYFGSTYGACKLFDCLAGTSKAVIHTNTDVLTEEIEQQPCQKADTVGRRLPAVGANIMFTFRNKLRCKTLPELQADFARTSVQLHRNFGTTSHRKKSGSNLVR